MAEIDTTLFRTNLEAARLAIQNMEQALDYSTPDIVVKPAPKAAESYFGDYGGFYDWLRADKMLGPKISQAEFEGCDAICRVAGEAGYCTSWLAYALATAYHETAHTLEPVKERGGDAYYKRMYDIEGSRPAKARELGNLLPGDGVKYAGRGLPQTTGKANYDRAAKKLKELGIGDWDLVGNPDLMLTLEVAAPTMIYGMRDGWFTGRKLSDDLRPGVIGTQETFEASRDIINGQDQKVLIAGYALGFQRGLVAGKYRIA